MPQKLETVLKHVANIPNEVNRQLIKDYHAYLTFEILAQLIRKTISS